MNKASLTYFSVRRNSKRRTYLTFARSFLTKRLKMEILKSHCTANTKLIKTILILSICPFMYFSLTKKIIITSASSQKSSISNTFPLFSLLFLIQKCSKKSVPFVSVNSKSSPRYNSKNSLKKLMTMMFTCLNAPTCFIWGASKTSSEKKIGRSVLFARPSSES